MGQQGGFLSWLIGLLGGSKPVVAPTETAEIPDEVPINPGLKPISSDELLKVDFSAEAVATQSISHALVLPDQNFLDWYRAAEPYTQKFARVAVVRSPAGNDLNRFRNITAVQAPNVWLNNNAVQHIRRVYPNVVRVDVITAQTPEQLKTALQLRINANDRYGETMNADKHIDDRFVLTWPSLALPARVPLPFNTDLDGRKHEGMDIYAPPGTTIRAPVGGTIALVVDQPTLLGYGRYVQISSIFGTTSYLITLARLTDIKVKRGQQIAQGTVIGLSDSQSIKLVVQQPGQGLSGYYLPNIVNPTGMIYWDNLRLQPTGDNLRVREKPGTQYPIVTQVGTADRLETLETHGRTLVKVGQNEQWINVRAPSGQTGYAAAWFLEAISPDIIDSIRLPGVNLDIMHSLGKPTPDRLGKISWVRFPYNVSFNPNNGSYGNTDLNATFKLYKPYIERYARAGYKVMLVFTHQTYGEGAGFNWNQMNSDRWRALTIKLAEMIRAIAGQYVNQNLVHAYQIWNEQDAPHGAGSSVPMPAGNYAFMLSESIRAIRAVDTKTKIITGGHTGGPSNGATYARQTIAALPANVRPDGIATHPYGRGPNTSSPYAIFGHIDDEIRAFTQIMPSKQIWITEWGVLDRAGDSPAAIADYAGTFLNHIKTRFPTQVETAIWYAWAQGMHNGYGLVGTDDKPRQPLYDRVLKY
jgi:murein DD-endopeptidase MepM/ murein hydrolase activator NlpD